MWTYIAIGAWIGIIGAGLFAIVDLWIWRKRQRLKWRRLERQMHHRAESHRSYVTVLADQAEYNQRHKLYDWNEDNQLDLSRTSHWDGQVDIPIE